jgi:hypothetical protein
MDQKHSRFTGMIAKLVVGGAVFAAAILAIDLGVSRAPYALLVPAYIIGLLAVVGAEILAWHNAAGSWFERRLGSVFAWGLLGVICSAGTLYTNYSTAASSQEATGAIKLASFNTYKDVDNTETELKTKVDKLNEQLRLAPVETAEAYDAKIENAKAHKFWKATDGCKETKGPQTREFCSAYSTAVANKANATSALTWKEEHKAASAELKAVRSERKTVKAETSGVNPAINLLKKAVFDGDEDKAKQMDSMSFPLLVQAIMILGGICLAAETYRFRDRKPWGVVEWLSRLAYRITHYGELPPVIHNHTDPHGRQALSGVEHLRRGILAAASPHMPRTA